MTGSLRGAHHEDQQRTQMSAGSRRLRSRQSWDDRGASAVEYALILAAVALGLVVVGYALQTALGTALGASVTAIESGAASAGSDDGSDDDGDGGSDDDGDEDEGPTQPVGSTAIAPGGDASFSSGVASGYTLASPSSSACSYSPSVSPGSASISVSEKKSSGTSQSVKFSVSSGAAHSQAVTATCTFKKGSSSTTKKFSIWIS